jgi:hypothetical protein
VHWVEIVVYKYVRSLLARRLWAWRAGATYLGWLFDWNLHIYTILTRVIRVDPRTVSWSPRKRFRAIRPKTE